MWRARTRGPALRTGAIFALIELRGFRFGPFFRIVRIAIKFLESH
jgi:hypothetical protein